MKNEISYPIDETLMLSIKNALFSMLFSIVGQNGSCLFFGISTKNLPPKLDITLNDDKQNKIY